ncbi:PREDICTED: RNA-binding protein 28-like [Priapulus caudatus]|uniref:RNA-binding protein 28-like n=1 Tax=Priapulus caudatus TaxID=37621 RepID=A0ABM1DW62_PRICU|nr:PREDICTED: RNA-binding protein 28-like [Priapulus caudatus]
MSTKTLFIRNLPFSATNNELESTFSHIGPIKKCFVVKETGTDKCRGFAYVTYSLREDAEKAIIEIKRFGNRQIFIEFASKETKKKRLKKAVNEEVAPETAGSAGTNINSSSSSGDKKPAGKTTVVILGLNDGISSDELNNKLKKEKNLQSVEFPAAGREQPTAMVTFRTIGSAIKSKRKINGQEFKGCRMQAFLLADEGKAPTQDPGSLKRMRLIARNVSFKCTEEDLKKAFLVYGEVVEVVMPKKPDGKKAGFAFVQFANIESASKAITGMNARELMGRKIAVDWALSKDKYQSIVQKEQKVCDTNTGHGDSKLGDTRQGDNGVGDSDSDEGPADKHLAHPSKESNNSSGEEEGDEDEEEEEEDEEEEEESDMSDGEGSDNNKKKSKPKNSIHPNDVEEGRTVFIRNLSYDSMVEDVQDLCSEFGDVQFVKICYHADTGHSKGVSFVQFKEKEAVEKCLEKANDESRDGGIVLDKRRLLVCTAVSRQKASNLMQAQKKEPKDNRNLYLAREGMIRSGTQAAEGTPAADLAKREQLELSKRRKLANTNVFVSTTRLCVRNLGKSVTDRQLSDAMLRGAGADARVVKARIMRDRTSVNSKNVAPSLGYGFLEFTEHKHALAALHAVNNKPDVFSNNKRPIVEFSLENTVALAAQQKRLERSQLKQAVINKRSGEAQQPQGKRGKNVAVAMESKQKGREATGDVPDQQRPGKKPRGLPSHFGPKIRHRNKGQAKLGNKPKQKISRTVVRRQTTDEVSSVTIDSQQDKKKRKRGGNKKRKPEKSDSLDHLINKYRRKLGADDMQKSKWFDN